MVRRTRSWMALVGMLGIVLVLQGCRKDEQNRPLLYHKGSYQGPSEPPLSEQRVEQLRSRAQNQKF